MASEEPVEAPPFLRKLKLPLIALLVLVVAWAVGGQLLWFWLNAVEFGDLFILPIYFGLVGGAALAAIALFRIDVKNGRSLTWWLIRLALRLLREGGSFEYVPPAYFDFKSFRLPPGKFLLWQVTKVLLGMLLFGNILFGLAALSMSRGWDPGLGQIWGVFRLPLVNPGFDMAYARENVIPLLPSLTLLVAPVLGALSFRLFALVVITQLVRILTPSIFTGVSGERLETRVSIFESVAAVVLIWLAFTSFFPPYIDYNTRFVIGGLVAAGAVLAIFAYLDASQGRGLSLLVRRHVYIRVGAIFLIALIAGSAMAVQNSIADARKVEWRGPYTAQEISVNRHLAQLDDVTEVPYRFSIAPVPPEQIGSYVADQSELLSKARLWDWDAAFAKLKPEIGLIPYIDFQDSDILRFNNTLYWSASMKPVLPPTVKPEDRWFVEHLFYTNVPSGFLILDGNRGDIVDTSQFFQQRRIYYGEGGLLDEVWSAYPTAGARSTEVGEHLYAGKGGIDIPPPLSWLFESNFLLAFRDQNMHVLRYRDVYQRMQILFPYFQYQFGGEPVDMFPVTDGKSTYWLMPLIVSLNTSNVPWSDRNPFRRLVGYSLIDTYNGTIQIIVVGDDYFSELFKRAYSGYITETIPRWLWEQVRYPAELFDWRVGMYNFYHITDPATFIVAKEFFEVPRGLETYFVISKPPGFDEPEFLGLLSLELRGAGGRNLAGYMVVRNDYPHLGEMRFYEVDIASPTKLLGPTAVIEALEKNPQFATLRTLLRTPRTGEIILYRVGDHDVYFIPVYTAGAGGVVTEMGAVAAVGATFEGEYNVGLAKGGTAQGAFSAFLGQLSGVEVAAPVVRPGPGVDRLLQLFEDKRIELVEPTELNPTVSFSEGRVRFASEEDWDATQQLISQFILNWGTKAGRVLMWSEDSKLNFGALVSVRGVVELHFVTVQLE